MGWYRVKLLARHRTSGQVQECDRRLIADHAQQATATAMALLGVDGRDWHIDESEATLQSEQRSVIKQK